MPASPSYSEEEQRKITRALARYHRLRLSDLEDARAALHIRPKGFAVLFSDFVRFAKQFGVNPAELARFVARRTSGIRELRLPKPDTPPLTEEERAIVRSEVPDGDWPRAILRLRRERSGPSN